MRCAAAKALLASSTLSAAPVPKIASRAVSQPSAAQGTTRCSRRFGATELEPHNHRTGKSL